MFKFLDASGATYWNGQETVYARPGPNEKYGPWNEHPEPCEPDGASCGPGGYHVMKRCDAAYAPQNWWPWYAQGRKLVGEDHEKARFVEVRLRRIAPAVWWRWLRLGLGSRANLRGAHLSGANLRGADLTWADLRGADLTWADLSGANLRGADVRVANLRGADLRVANLRGADLRGAYLRGAIGLEDEKSETD